MSDPVLRERLSQPDDKLSSADKELKAQIVSATDRLQSEHGSKNYGDDAPTGDDVRKALFSDGHIPAETKLAMGFALKDVISELPSAPQAERDNAAHYLITQEREVVESAAKNRTAN